MSSGLRFSRGHRLRSKRSLLNGPPRSHPRSLTEWPQGSPENFSAVIATLLTSFIVVIGGDHFHEFLCLVPAPPPHGGDGDLER